MLRLLMIAACLFAAPGWAQDRSILVLGDSLSAGYGFSVDRGWVALLGRRLADKGYNYDVHNASISGDTSHGALARLPEVLARVRPRLTIVELGGNDGLRGIALSEFESNLGAIIRGIAASGSAILLIPMRMPPNYGPVYTEGFARIYETLGAEPGVVPGKFLLEGVALDRGLMQGDGIHPTEAAQPRILDNVWQVLEPMLAADAHNAAP